MSNNAKMTLLMLAILGLFAYALTEATTRLVIFPKSGTAVALNELEAKLKETPNLEELGKKDDWNPITGWGLAKVQTYTSATTASGTLVLVGDSVTAGHGVSPTQSYAAKYQLALGGGWRLENWGVNGFGVDQMLLKLQARQAETEGAKAILFAYIPHNLIRPANGYLYGVTKPRFQTQSGTFTPAQNMADFLAAYHHARSFGYLSAWLLNRYVKDRAYYLPQYYLQSYYRPLYAHIIGQLSAMATVQRPVYVLRLTNFLPFKAQAGLQQLWNDELDNAIAANPNLHHINLDECVGPLITNSNLSAQEEFAFHPHAAGHALYGYCLTQQLPFK